MTPWRLHGAAAVMLPPWIHGATVVGLWCSRDRQYGAPRTRLGGEVKTRRNPMEPRLAHEST